MQPPSVWSTALDPVEECVMTLLQKSISEVLAMATHDQGLSCERTRAATCAGALVSGSALSRSRGSHIAGFEPWRSWPVG